MFGLLMGQFVHSAFAIDIMLSSTTGCTPYRVGANVIEIVPDSVIWDFGNGSTGKGATVFNIYNESGIFIIKAKIYKGGVETIITKSVTAHKAPTADFEFSPSVGCPPLNVSFNDKSTNGSSPIKEWTWDFGNGTSMKGTEKKPSITYFTPNVRDVALVIEDQNGCKNTKTYPKAITVLAKPIVDFEIKNANSCILPVETSTTNKTKSSLPVTYKWDFGDGGTSEDFEPSHTYTKDGNFLISLIATDENGCKDKKEINNLIVDENFSVDIKFTDTLGCGSLTTQFEPVVSSLYRSLKWTFDPALDVYMETQTINGSVPGIYKVKVEATSQFGCVASQERTLYIDKVPNVDFVANPVLTCQIPQNVKFTNLSTDAVSYKWTFGNGGASTDVHPQMTYSKFGEYIVRLVAFSEHGCTEQLVKPKFISIVKPQASIEALKSGGCVPFSTTYKVVSTNGFTVSNVKWDFGNGNTYIGVNPPVQIYNSTGTFTVKAIVSFKEGCEDLTLSEIIKVGSNNNISASISSNSICPGTPLTGQANAISGATYEWHIGNDTIIKSRTFSFKFLKSGIFPVSVKVITSGCESVKNMGNVTVKETAADFSIVRNCGGGEVSFKNINYQGVISTWDFGDGTVMQKNESSFSYKYKNLGTYQVKLTVQNNSTGCSDVITKEVIVSKTHTDAYTLPKVKGCAPLEVEYLAPEGSNANHWSFADTLLTGSKFKYTFNKSDSYDLTLVSIKGACRDTLVFKNQIQAIKPDAGFEFDPIGGCAPITVNFKDTSSSKISNITKYNWDIGGIAKKTDKSFSYDFSLTAIVPIVLMVEDNFGCKDTAKNNVVIAYPYAEFYIPVESFCTGNAFKPVNLSSGVGLEYFWDFGDGTPISKDSFPSHYYEKEGVYDMSLKIIDANNCVDTMFVKNAITISDIKYDFDAYPRTKICPELLTNFEIIPANITYRNTTWDFGNGNISDDTARFPTNLYLQAGTYDVSLILEDFRGCVDTIKKEKFIDINGPSGRFIVSDTAACAPIEVSINASVKNSIANFWDFGDGEGHYDTAAVSSIKHQYKEPGVYQPSVTVDDGQGCIVTVNGPKVRVGGPNAKINASSLIVCNGEELVFSDTSTFETHSPIRDRNWKFSDGFSSSDSLIKYNFSTQDSSSYVVRLTVTDSLGCLDMDSVKVRVFQKAPLEIQDKYAICKGDTIQLYAAGVHYYEWSKSGTLDNMKISNPKAFPIQTTDYHLRGYVSPTCYTDSIVKVEVKNTILGEAGPDTVLCKGQSVELFVHHDTIHSGHFSYSWYADGQWIDSTKNVIVAPQKNVIYTIQVKNGSCRDLNIPIYVEVENLPSLTVSDDVDVLKGQPTLLESYSDKKVSYSWTPNNFLSCDNCPFPTATPIETIVYTVTATDEFGCKVSEDIKVNVHSSCDGNLIQIQNVFTPNNDGVNDFFSLKNNNFVQLEHIRIYSRSGEMVFESRNAEDAWDGMVNNSPLNTGVYVYFIEGRCENGEPILLKGNVTLLR
ncbi:MAG: PKD domain-containing protein [Chitinophagales bacterium]|nr:PKD domain-containing protein [Chitinophagales bacterium]MCZ2394757.1 PKD domain-containing protein [Chitinophagales bacterium]